MYGHKVGAAAVWGWSHTTKLHVNKATPGTGPMSQVFPTSLLLSKVTCERPHASSMMTISEGSHIGPVAPYRSRRFLEV